MFYLLLLGEAAPEPGGKAGESKYFVHPNF